MRTLLFAGVSALALTSPALAQQADQAKQSAINALEPADKPQPTQAPKPTGNSILDRLNALEARVQSLEARNAQLQQQVELDKNQLHVTATKTAKEVQFGWAPSISDANGNFTFKPRGVIDVDAVAFNEHEGGYQFNDGTGFRRTRIGFEGKAFKWFNYRLEADFAGNAVNLTDAYLQYTKIPDTVLTIGQHKAPFGLESNNSDNYNIFIERGMFTNAFANAGAERRIGVSAAYSPKPNVNIAGGVFGDNESINRGTGTAPGESWGINGRATWEPVYQEGRIIHLGLSGFYRTHLKSGDVADAVRLNDKPNVRVDNGNIADSGVITGVKSMSYAGAEAAGVLGPLTVAGEAGRLWLDRPDLGNRHFTGYYGYAAYMLTGETRPFKGGNFDRIHPFHQLGNGGLGAFEVALRYDHIDLADTPVAKNAGNRATSITAGLNWYFNPFAKLMFNWVHFWGEDTPLDPIGNRTSGDAFATRLHLDF